MYAMVCTLLDIAQVMSMVNQIRVGSTGLR